MASADEPGKPRRNLFGGKPGPGRPRGRRNKATIEKTIRAEHGLKAALNTGIMPLDVLLGRMRGTMDVTNEQVEVAIAAAPYCHPKLSAVAFRDTTPPTDLIDLSNATAAELAVIRKFLLHTPAAAADGAQIEVTVIRAADEESEE